MHNKTCYLNHFWEYSSVMSSTFTSLGNRSNFSSSKKKTLTHHRNHSALSFPPAPGSHHSTTFCSYESDFLSYLPEVECTAGVFCTSLFLWLEYLWCPRSMWQYFFQEWITPHYRNILYFFSIHRSMHIWITFTSQLPWIIKEYTF